MTAFSRAPGPRGRDFLRTLLRRRRDPLAMQRHLTRSYGDVVYIQMGSMNQFLLNDPAAVWHVLVENAQNYTKGPGYELLSSLLGRGLVTSEGDHWRRHRKLVQPVLHRERLVVFARAMAEAVAEEGDELAAAARRGETVDMFQHMSELALRIIARTVLGSDVRDREAEVHHAAGIVFDRVESLSVSRLRYLELLPGGNRLRWILRAASALPTPGRKRFDEAIATLNDVIYDVVARRRSQGVGPDGPSDLVGVLLRASDAERAEGPGFSDEDLRDEVMTMFVAGHETVATTLTWAFYLLALHPEYQRQIREEANEVLGDRAPTFADLPQLRTAERVFKEALRLYPAIWRFSRWAVGPDRLGGYDVPAGSVVTISPYLLHRNPAYWSDPEVFDPSRFEADDSPEPPRGVYIPFGAGRRMCPGASFGTAEAQIVLSTLCRRVAFEVPPGFEPSFEPRIALRPRGGMPLRLKPANSRSLLPTT